jgi:hypothetical protein
LLSLAFGVIELSLVMSLLLLVHALTPGEPRWLSGWLAGDSDAAHRVLLLSTGAYVLVVGFLQPFYVSAGFALYLNRRVELEAWDIEQELRRAAH